jgi:hypothetical protein
LKPSASIAPAAWNSSSIGSSAAEGSGSSDSEFTYKLAHPSVDHGLVAQPRNLGRQPVCSGYERVWILEDSETRDPLLPLFDLVLAGRPFEEEIGFGRQRRDEAVPGRRGDCL